MNFFSQTPLFGRAHWSVTSGWQARDISSHIPLLYVISCFLNNILNPNRSGLINSIIESISYWLISISDSWITCLFLYLQVRVYSPFLTSCGWVRLFIIACMICLLLVTLMNLRFRLVGKRGRRYKNFQIIRWNDVMDMWNHFVIQTKNWGYKRC